MSQAERIGELALEASDILKRRRAAHEEVGRMARLLKDLASCLAKQDGIEPFGGGLRFSLYGEDHKMMQGDAIGAVAELLAKRARDNERLLAINKELVGLGLEPQGGPADRPPDTTVLRTGPS